MKADPDDEGQDGGGGRPPGGAARPSARTNRISANAPHLEENHIHHPGRGI
jgi:hypothetical protein